MKRTVKVVALLVLLSMVLSGCAKMPLWFIKYDEDWIIGKTKAQIEAKYGEFDCYMQKEKATGGYYYIGQYTLKEERVGYLGTYHEEWFKIKFDETGIAYDCYEDWPRGG